MYTRVVGEDIRHAADEVQEISHAISEGLREMMSEVSAKHRSQLVLFAASAKIAGECAEQIKASIGDAA